MVTQVASKTKRRTLPNRVWIALFGAIILAGVAGAFLLTWSGSVDGDYLNVLGGGLTLSGLFLQAVRSLLPAWWKADKSTIPVKTREKTLQRIDELSHPLVLFGALLIAAVYLAVFVEKNAEGSGESFRTSGREFLLEPIPSLTFVTVVAYASVVIYFVIVRWLLTKLKALRAKPKTVVSGAAAGGLSYPGDTPTLDRAETPSRNLNAP